jgi:hypothetical protein
MKRFIINPQTKRYIDADSANGKKIRKEKQAKNEHVEFFSDKKGTPLVQCSSTVNVVSTKAKKEKKAPKKEKKAPKKEKKAPKLNHVQQVNVPPEEVTVRAPDPSRVMRLVSHSPLSIIPGMNDELNNILRMSLDTFHNDNTRRHNHVIEESRRHGQMRRMMLQDEEAKQREEDERRRADLDNNLRHYRVVRFTMNKKENDKKNKKKEEEHKLRIQNEALKEKLEKQKKNNEERQKRMKALKARLKKKN